MFRLPAEYRLEYLVPYPAGYPKSDRILDIWPDTSFQFLSDIRYPVIQQICYPSHPYYEDWKQFDSILQSKHFHNQGLHYTKGLF